MVKTEVKKLSSSKREMKIVMPKEAIDEIREAEAQRVRKEVELPGFRKGRAPLGMVKRRYQGLIEAYTMERAFKKGLFEAAEQEKIEILSLPEAKDVKFDDEGNLVALVEFETTPDIEVKKYKGIVLSKDKYVITDKFVEENIDQLRRERAEVTAIEGPVEEGHRVTIDMQELDSSGVPIVGRKYENVDVKVGEGRVDKDIEQQIVGMKKGETKKVEKVYPDDFPQADYAGKKEWYEITVKEIFEEKIPELTDKFVEELGDDELKTVDDLKKRIRENLEKRYQDESEKRLEDDLIQTLLAENPFEVPKVKVEDYIQNLVNQARRQFPGASEEQLRALYEANAETMVKWYYLTHKIAEIEGIEVSDDEVREFLKEHVEDEKEIEKEMANKHQVDHLKNDLFYDKVKKFLLENAEIKENEIKLD